MPMPENAALTLPWLARARAFAAMTNHDDAVRWLNENGQHRAARIMQKASVGAGSTLDSDAAAMLGAFSTSMSTASVFFRLLNDVYFRRLPMHQRIGLISTPPSAGVPGEGQAAPVSRVVISPTILQPVTIVSMLVCTRELLLDPSAESAFNRELKSVLGQAVDAAFLSVLLDDTSAITISSSGDDAADAITDVLSALLLLGTVGDASKLVWLLASDVAKRGSLLGAEGGGVFPGLTPSGGDIRGVLALVSNGMPAGSALLFDASQIAAAATGIDVGASQSAALEMSDAPAHDAITPTAAQVVSMFQTNSVALRAVATIAAARLRSDAAVLVENISWGGNPVTT